MRHKGVLPKDTNDIPQIQVLQAGEVKINCDSKKSTPDMGANHMIVAGVTGKCTSDAGKIPDIRRYEAEDLVAACFLTKYAENPKIEPDNAKKD